MSFRGVLVASLLAPISFLATSAQAAAVSGEANIAGNVNVTSSSILFNPVFTNTVGAMETGSFSGLTGGTIMPLTGGPVTGATYVPGFISFNQGVASPITFDLTYIAPGAGSAAACTSSAPGTVCTPEGSPFTLLQLTSDTVVASLQLNGNAYTGTSADGSSFTRSVFSTQTVVGGTIPGILARLSSGETLTGITYSASFAASPVPEPASMLLMGLGLTGAGVLARRRGAKRA